MPKTPPRGPHGTVVIDGRSHPVTLSQAVLSWMLDESYTREANIGSVNAGVRTAQATADGAQVTANSAAQTAQDQQSNDFMVTIDSPFAIVLSEQNIELTTDAVTVTPSGGTGPYLYAWTKVSGDDVTINSPTAATTTFTATPDFNSSLAGVYRCTVTDSLAATASITVSVAISHIFITG